MYAIDWFSSWRRMAIAKMWCECGGEKGASKRNIFFYLFQSAFCHMFFDLFYFGNPKGTWYVILGHFQTGE